MSVFTLVQKRAYLQAALSRSPHAEPSSCVTLERLRALPLRERSRFLAHLDEDQLDEMISAHIRSLSKRITRSFAAEEAWLQPA